MTTGIDNGDGMAPATLAGFEFTLVAEIEPERDEFGSVIEHLPWAHHSRSSLPFNAFGKGPFCRFKIPRHWGARTGVYLFVVDGIPMYVGECADLGHRINSGYGAIAARNCYRGGQETNCRINNAVMAAAHAGARILLWFHKTSERFAVEAQLLSELPLEWNLRRSAARSRRVPATQSPPPRLPDGHRQDDRAALGEQAIEFGQQPEREVTSNPTQRRTTMTSIDEIWRRIEARQGEVFRQIRGGEFRYRVSGGYLELSRTNHKVSRSDLEEALRLVPLKNTTPVHHLRAPSYIFAILMDDRIRRGDW